METQAVAVPTMISKTSSASWLGAAGVLLVTAGGVERIRAPVVPVRSKVGAGDSTVAAMVLSLSRGEDPRQAAYWGVAAGAAAVMTPGTELYRREDVERVYREMRAHAT